WSSHTRILAMRYLRIDRRGLMLRLRRLGMQDFQNKFSSAAGARLDVNLGAMRLHDLIDNGQAQPGAALKMGLERFKDFFRQVRGNPGAGITNADAQEIALRTHRDRDGAF